MKIDTPSAQTCPVGLINECEMINTAPGREKDIIDHAIRIREREKVYNKEIRGMLTLHPLHTTRVAIIVGVVTFVIALLLSEIASFGQWYAQLKSYKVDVPVPLVGNETLNFGGLVPTSTALSVASVIPVIGVVGSFYLALGVVFALLLEKVIVAALHVKEAHALKTYDDELTNELAVLREWRKRY